MLQLQEINSKYNMRVNFLNDGTIKTILRKFILQFINGNDFQYRIIRRIIGTQEFLHKIKQSDLVMCRLCGQCCETITHLFLVCNRINSLW